MDNNLNLTRWERIKDSDIYHGFIKSPTAIISSAILFNNSLISKNENFIEFYNIKNGNLFSKININKILNKKSKIINSLIINKNIHLFTDYGEIIIFDQNLEIQETVNLKIKNINKVYNYQNKIFISTEKGITYIY